LWPFLELTFLECNNQGRESRVGKPVGCRDWIVGLLRRVTPRKLPHLEKKSIVGKEKRFFDSKLVDPNVRLFGLFKEGALAQRELMFARPRTDETLSCLECFWAECKLAATDRLAFFEC